MSLWSRRHFEEFSVCHLEKTRKQDELRITRNLVILHRYQEISLSDQRRHQTLVHHSRPQSNNRELFFSCKLLTLIIVLGANFSRCYNINFHNMIWDCILKFDPFSFDSRWDAYEHLLVCQKKVSMAWTNNYIPQYLWDVITCPCPWHLPLAHNPHIYSILLLSSNRTFEAQQLFTDRRPNNGTRSKIYIIHVKRPYQQYRIL